MKRLSGLLSAAALWQGAVLLTRSPLLVSIPVILQAMAAMARSGELLEHAKQSLERVLVGFVLAALFGVALGVWIYQDKTIDLILTPLIDALRPIAALTLFPVIILAMGLGLASKAFVIFWTAYPACLISTTEGLRQVDRQVIDAARLDGASESQLLLNVTLPLAAPSIVAGLRVGLSGGWISLVAAEMLGALSGLGWAVMAYSSAFDFPRMYAVILTIALIGLAMNSALGSLQHLIDFKES